MELDSFFDESWNLMLPPSLSPSLPSSSPGLEMVTQWLIVHSCSRERAREWVKAEVGARNSLRTPSAAIRVKLTCCSYALNFEHPCRQTDPAKASDRGVVVSYSEAVTVMDETFFSEHS